MGYSCTTKASETERKWQEVCRKSTGSSNTYKDKTGTEFFYEIGKENDDGAITGTIWKSVSEAHCVRSGSFRINPDGSVARGPAFLKGL